MGDIYQHPVFFECGDGGPLGKEQAKRIETYFRVKRKSGGGDCGALERVIHRTHRVLFKYQEVGGAIRCCLSQDFLLMGLTWLFTPGDLTGGYGEEERGRCNHWHRQLSGKSVASAARCQYSATTQWRVCDESPAAKLKWQDSSKRTTLAAKLWVEHICNPATNDNKASVTLTCL
ncbi:hypothetical protein EYF80_064591 [Liparis tanakae]|uniref:Uncharacterized protein n=1 Tax=Liparis tanakae TaxID=230148 RepID=A0A4Z2E951_9TELE|nr:hypothetical protein EYF80_064591 [Liparis tanakae]